MSRHGSDPDSGEDAFERLLDDAVEAEDDRIDGDLGVFALARASVHEAALRRRESEAHLDRVQRSERRAAERARQREAARARAAEGDVRRRRSRVLMICGLCAVGLLGVGAVGAGAVFLGSETGEPEAAVGSARGADAEAPGREEAATDESGGSGAALDDDAEEESEEAAMIDVDPAWASRVAEEAQIPERAFRAYAGAALTLAEEQPGCGLGWNTLAAIGFVETEHGAIHGSRMGEDGRVLPRVYGVQLDGTVFDAIPDTDGGSIDGDAQWDRAVGPMQFIPQTWREYGRDANGDGRADVDQIDDAALSAATMLCTAGGDVSVPENWIAAVNAYNPSVSYNNDVVEAADHYGRFG